MCASELLIENSSTSISSEKYVGAGGGGCEEAIVPFQEQGQGLEVIRGTCVFLDRTKHGH